MDAQLPKPSAKSSSKTKTLLWYACRLYRVFLHTVRQAAKKITPGRIIAVGYQMILPRRQLAQASGSQIASPP